MTYGRVLGTGSEVGSVDDYRGEDRVSVVIFTLFTVVDTKGSETRGPNL